MPKPATARPRTKHERVRRRARQNASSRSRCSGRRTATAPRAEAGSNEGALCALSGDRTDASLVSVRQRLDLLVVPEPERGFVPDERGLRDGRESLELAEFRLGRLTLAALRCSAHRRRARAGSSARRRGRRPCLPWRRAEGAPSAVWRTWRGPPPGFCTPPRTQRARARDAPMPGMLVSPRSSSLAPAAGRSCSRVTSASTSPKPIGPHTAPPARRASPRPPASAPGAPGTSRTPRRFRRRRARTPRRAAPKLSETGGKSEPTRGAPRRRSLAPRTSRP